VHCKQEPTSGCIAMSESRMLNVLAWLEQSKNPHILIWDA